MFEGDACRADGMHGSDGGTVEIGDGATGPAQEVQKHRVPEHASPKNAPPLSHIAGTEAFASVFAVVADLAEGCGCCRLTLVPAGSIRDLRPYLTHARSDDTEWL